MIQHSSYRHPQIVLHLGMKPDDCGGCRDCWMLQGEMKSCAVVAVVVVGDVHGLVVVVASNSAFDGLD